MKQSIKTGLSFGLTSGIITTLGLMVGLDSGTGSKLVVIGGILTIAVADAFSDALGIHISEESDTKQNKKQIWESTISTFLSKLIFASLFIIPILLLPLQIAVPISVILGLSLLTIFSYNLSKNKTNRKKAAAEHLTIGIIVIVISYFIGKGVSLIFT